jgi:exosortase/archaeosortase family protein
MGLFTLALAVWVQLRDARPSVKRFAWATLGLVAVQAVLGGMRVRFVAAGIDETPTWLKVLHAVTGQAYFCCLAALATCLAPGWRRAARPLDLDTTSMTLLRTSLVGFVLLLAQALLGALARHGVLVREVHALAALPVLLVVAKLVLAGVWDVPAGVREIRRPASALGVLAAVQLALGLVSYFIASSGVAPESRETAQIVLMNLHLAVGAAMLGLTLSLLMRTLRVFGLPTDERVARAERAAAGAAS